MGWELARVTAGWATEGTQSEDTTEEHVQTPRPRCGRRETTAAHIPAAGASPGQEAELAVAEGGRGARRAAGRRGVGRASARARGGYTVCQALVQNYWEFQDGSSRTLSQPWGPLTVWALGSRIHEASPGQ